MRRIGCTNFKFHGNLASTDELGDAAHFITTERDHDQVVVVSASRREWPAQGHTGRMLPPEI